MTAHPAAFGPKQLMIPYLSAVSQTHYAELNSSHDMRNADATGNPVEDRQPYAADTNGNPLYRIRVGTDGPFDPDLIDLSLHLSGATSGSYQLTYSSRLRLWDVTDPAHPAIVPSGQAVPVTVPSGGRDVPLKVEGVGLSQASADATLTATAAGAGAGPSSVSYAFTVLGIAQYIDADNNNGFGLPDASQIEGAYKQDPAQPGKIIAAADGDADADGTPDFADGYDRDHTAGTADDTAGAAVQFVPVVVGLGDAIDIAKATVRFDYGGSDPAHVTASGANPTVYTPAPGFLRLWKSDGSAARNGAALGSGGDYLQPGVAYSAAQLGFTAPGERTIYVEGIRAVDSSDDADRTIVMTVTADSTDPFATLKPARTTVTVVPSTTGNLTGRVTQDGAGVAVTAHVTADNHYGLYYGTPDGSDLTYLGRNEFDDAGSKGGHNWTDAETDAFRMPGTDYLYVSASNSLDPPMMYLADFQFSDGSTLTTNPTDWEYAVADPRTDPSLVPTADRVGTWVAAANAANAWHHPTFAVNNGGGLWGSLDGPTPEVSPTAQMIWTTSANADDDRFVVFRAHLPAGLPTAGTGDRAGLANRTVFADAIAPDGTANGTLDPGETSAVTAADGTYALTGLAPGTYNVHQLAPAGWQIASPLNPVYQRMHVDAGQTVSGIDFIQAPTVAGSQPPTITGAATAAPATVTGTTTALTVTAADDGGESHLRYSWTAVVGPAAAVSFSANGTNAAKAVTATFTHAGTYTLRVVATDDNGLSSPASDVTVTVQQTLTTLAVSPATVTVPLSTATQASTQQFTASAVDQFGDAMSAPAGVTWSASGGTVDATGLYTAPATGTAATVTATANGLTATAQITLNGTGGQPGNGSPAITNLTASAVSADGRTVTLSATVTGTGIINLDWAMAIGPTGANPTFSDTQSDATGHIQATVTFDLIGSYTFSLNASNAYGTTIAISPIVSIVPVLAGLSVLPSSGFLSHDSTKIFTAYTVDQFLVVTGPTMNVAWSCNTGSISVISGSYTAPSTGSVATIICASTEVPSVITSFTIKLTDSIQVAAIADSPTHVNINWTDVGQGSQYQIFRGTTPDFEANYTSLIAEPNVPNFEDDTVDRDTTYYYTVLAQTGSASTQSSGNTTTATPTSSGPLQPNNNTGGPATYALYSRPSSVNAVGVNDLEILVSWNNNAKNQLGTVIQISDDGQHWNNAGFAPAAATNWIIRGWGPHGADFLQRNTTYSIRACAKGDDGISVWSTIATASVKPPDIYVDLGRDLLAVFGGNRQPMEYLLAGVSVLSNGTISGTGNSVGSVWLDKVKIGYNAFLTPDPHDGGAPSPGIPPFAVPNDETNVILCNDGSGRFYDEVVYELNYRGVRDIGLVAYSHGGGMSANFSSRLFYNNSLPIFSRIVVAETIDAVEYGTAADALIGLNGWYDSNPQPTSPAAIWGCAGDNYWEPSGWKYLGSAGNGRIRGTNMPGVPNTQLPALTHSQIAVDPWTLKQVSDNVDYVFESIGF